MPVTPWTTTTEPTGLALHTWTDSPVGAPRLLLLHGLTDAGPAWEDAARRWSSGYEVLAPDALGHGASRRLTDQELASSDPMAATYAALDALLTRLDTGDDRPLVVVGHSMGGGLAAALAARRPDVVRAAVLEDPVWHAQTPDPRRRASRAAARERVADTMRARESLADVIATGRRRFPDWPACEIEPWAQAKADCDVDFLRLSTATLAEPWQDIARAITVPTLVVTGSDDDIIIDAQVRREIAALGNPRIEVAVVDGAWHCVRRCRTEDFHTVVDPWIAAHIAAQL